jgi:hypothetical protein
VKLCIDCAHYGGVAPQHGKYICNEPRNKFVHPVDGLECKYDASWLRMTPPEFTHFCGMEGKWWAPKPPSTPGA